MQRGSLALFERERGNPNEEIADAQDRGGIAAEGRRAIDVEDRVEPWRRPVDGERVSEAGGQKPSLESCTAANGGFCLLHQRDLWHD